MENTRAGGEAVAMARKMLFIFIFDDEINATRMAQTKPLETVAGSSNFVLYPNPNNGSMTLEYHLQDNDVAVLSIYDITGRLIKQYPINAKSTLLCINERELQSGSYFYNVIVNQKLYTTQLLVIIK